MNICLLDVEHHLITACACILDPRHKRKYFTSAEALLAAAKVIKEELLSMCTPPETATAAPSPRPEGTLSDHKDYFNGPLGTDMNVQLAPLVSLEYDSYISVPVMDEKVDPLMYWQDEERFQNLRILAKKYLCVMGTSVPSDRLFSQASNILTLKRNRLDKETLGKFLFISKCPKEDFDLPRWVNIVNILIYEFVCK